MTKEAYFAQGMAKVKENDHAGAIALFTKVLELDPKNADALSQRAIAYLNLEQYDLSLFDMNKAVEYDPEYSFRYQSRGYLKFRIKDYDGAIADYEKAVELDPEDGIAYNNLALAQEQLGYMKKAQANFEKSDQLTGVKTNKTPEAKTPPPEVTQQKQEKASEKYPTRGEIVKSVLTDKKGFKEFLRFIRNGFKLD